jgi:hypothetical protein
MNDESLEQMAIELGRLCIRVDGLKEDRKESAADYASQIKTCEKEIRRLAMQVQQQKGLFEKAG